MLPLELRPRQFPCCPHTVASVFPRGGEAQQGGDGELQPQPQPGPPANTEPGSAGVRPGDELLPGCFVIDELYTGKDLLRVTINVSLVERLMGPASAATLRDLRRMTVAAFAVIGGDHPRSGHHISEDMSAGVVGGKPVAWPWAQPDRPAGIGEGGADALIESVRRQHASNDARRALRSLCFLVLLVAGIVYLAFSQTTSSGRQRQSVSVSGPSDEL